MKLRCPFCRQAFPWEAALPFPRVCPLCAEEIGIPDRGEVIQMPSLRSAKTKAVDKTYRDIEAGSEVRVERAAEVTGTAKEDMAALRITDMADNMRAGDIAAKGGRCCHEAVAIEYADEYRVSGQRRGIQQRHFDRRRGAQW